MEKGLTIRRKKADNNEDKDGSKAKSNQTLTLSSAAGEQHQNLLRSQFGDSLQIRSPSALTPTESPAAVDIRIYPIAQISTSGPCPS